MIASLLLVMALLRVTASDRGSLVAVAAARIGRPRVSREVLILIPTMGRDKPGWGAERNRGEPLKLGIAVSKASI